MFKCSSDNCNCHIFHEDTLIEVNNNLRDDNSINNIANFLKLIANDTRLKMLEAIKDHELCVCDLGHLLGVTKSAISHQIKELKKYDLVSERREGKMVYYKLNSPFVSKLIEEVGANI